MQVQSIVQQLLEVVCPGMHRVRRASLAASVLGALRGRRLTVTAIGRALPGGTSQKHAIKRACQYRLKIPQKCRLKIPHLYINITIH